MQSRRDFLKASTLAMASGVFASSRGYAQSAAKPNIVYILLDDAGYGDLGCYGQKTLKTPNMDRLAKEGMRFTQHYSGSTVCAPTRCTLMTGLHTGHASVRGNHHAEKENEPENVLSMREESPMLAELLKEQGYATGCFGKWGIGGPGSKSDALKKGFDKFCGFYNQGYAHDFYPRWIWRNGEKIVLNREKYVHDLIMDDALSFIRENKDKPFFCYLPVTIPHAAMQVPKEYHDRFRKEFPQFEEKVGKYSGDDRRVEVTNPIAGFAGMMTKMDDDVGRLLALLKELNLDENTLVMLSSDNGPHGEGGHDPEFWDSNGPLKGMKRDLYEGGVRIPLMARWPGKVQPGSQSDHISAHWDLLPTLCAVAGQSIPEDRDGISFLPTLLGESGQKEHEYLYWEFYERGGKRATRFGDWKAVQLNVGKEPDGPIEVYNLATDLGEEKDLAADHPEIVAQAKAIFEKAHTPDPRWNFKVDIKRKKKSKKKSKKD